jgi:hypothetical protein
MPDKLALKQNGYLEQREKHADDIKKQTASRCH